MSKKKKIVLAVIAGVLVLGVIGGLAGGGDETATVTAPADSQPTTEVPSATTASVTVEPPATTATATTTVPLYSCEDIIDEVEDLESGLTRVRAINVRDYRQVDTDSEYNLLKCHGTATLTTGEDELIVFGVREVGGDYLVGRAPREADEFDPVPEGSFANPADWQGPLGTDELTLQVVSLGWQTDVSAYNFFDEELCAETESGYDCEVLEGKGVLVLRYDVARVAGEPGSFFFSHKLAMDNGLVVDGSSLHCAGDDMIELAPGGDPQPHETCFVVDVAEIGDRALIGLSDGMFTDTYWVEAPIGG